jgi:hypothetical protein
MNIISKSIEEAYNKQICLWNNIKSHKNLLPLEEQINIFHKEFLDKYIDNDKKIERIREKDSLFLAEVWMRFIAQKIYRVFHMQIDQNTDGLYKTSEFLETKYKINPQKIFKIFSKEEKKVLQIQCIKGKIEDATQARLFFYKNDSKEEETSWELYKRYDLKGKRKMHLASFYSLMPKDWRKLNNYTKIEASYEDCQRAEEWFNREVSNEEETSWELYERYDPEGKRKMHLANFYSLMPKDWRKLNNYTKINASYEDCQKAEEWFNIKESDEEETSWELYKKYDPEGKRKMHLAHFYSLMPKDWRKLNNYICIHASYEECLNAEKNYNKITPQIMEIIKSQK